MRAAPPYPEGHDLLRQRNAVVTAAAGTGIGFAAARRFCEEGASVLISDIHPGRLEEAADRLEEETGSRPLTALCNVTVEDDVQAMIAAAIEGLGHIDIVVNNAGLGGTSDLVTMTDSEWHTVLDVTLNGTMRVTRAALPHLYERGSGVIVNNASVLGWRAQAGQAHYAAAKAGVMALTRTVAIEAAEHGVRVNCVAPSLAMHEFLSKVSSQEVLDELVGREAFGRAAEVWEVANVMVFLASDLSSYMTGEIVSVSSQHP